MNDNNSMQQESGEVLDFWFRELTPRQWFGGGAGLDAVVRERFSVLLEKVANNACDDWAATARGRLALIIVLDQFSRHIHRHSAEAFAQDGKAQQLCVAGIGEEMDRQLTSVERHFFYMPLMHAESRELQALGVEKFTALRDEAEAVLGFAREHAAIVEQFGHFPHRNAALGRASSPREAAFLVSGANKFA